MYFVLENRYHGVYMCPRVRAKSDEHTNKKAAATQRNETVIQKKTDAQDVGNVDDNDDKKANWKNKF